MSLPGTFEQWLKAIKTVGFPIVAALALSMFIVRYIGPMFDANTVMIRNCTEAIPAITVALGKLTTCQEKQNATNSRLVRFLERAEKAVGVPDPDAKPIAIQPREQEKPEL